MVHRGQPRGVQRAVRRFGEPVAARLWSSEGLCPSCSPYSKYNTGGHLQIPLTAVDLTFGDRYWVICLCRCWTAASDSWAGQAVCPVPSLYQPLAAAAARPRDRTSFLRPSLRRCSAWLIGSRVLSETVLSNCVSLCACVPTHRLGEMKFKPLSWVLL
jgi:hypothetical protein